MKKMSDAELLKHLRENLETIHDLCRIYDNGRHYIAFILATEVRKVLVDNPAGTRWRGEREFPTPKNAYRHTNLLAEFPLVHMDARIRSEGRPGEIPTANVCFQPAAVEPIKGIEWMPFRNWWNKENVFRASAAPKGSPAHLIPTDQAKQVPRHKRDTMTRRTFVDLMRNKLGAHIDSEIPEELDGLQKAFHFGMDLIVAYPGGELSLHGSTVTIEVGPAAAMMREIAHEVLWASAGKQQQPPLHRRAPT